MIVHWLICRLSFSTRDVAAAAAVVAVLFVVAVLSVVAALFVVAAAAVAALFVVAVSVAQLPYEVSNIFFLLQAVDQQYQTTIENSCLKNKNKNKKDDNKK
jgi:hypothetical protein